MVKRANGDGILLSRYVFEETLQMSIERVIRGGGKEMEGRSAGFLSITLWCPHTEMENYCIVMRPKQDTGDFCHRA